MHLQKRLMTFFIIVSIIPLIAIGSLSVYLSLSSTKASAIEFSESTMQQVRIRIESTMDSAGTVSLQLADDTIIQRNLKEPLQTDVASKFKTDLEIDTYLNYEMAYMTELYGLYVLGENGAKYRSAYNSFYPEDLRSTLWYEAIRLSDEPIWFTAHKDSFAVNTSSQLFISRGMKIDDLSSKQALGIILVDIELDLIENILHDAFGDYGQVMIVDDIGHIVVSTDNLFEDNDYAIQQAIDAPFKYPGNHLITAFDSDIILHYPLTDSNWHLVGVIPASSIMKDSMISIGILLGLIIFISFISYFVAKVITSTITEPIDGMISQMREVEQGNFSVNTEVLYDDEIGNLGHNFNNMTERVRDLMEKNIEEQRNLRKYELKALQAQINPHLLYNTLGSIIWLARLNKNDDIIDIVTAMTQLFRTSLSRGKDIIPVEEEIGHVSSFLKIQNYRYSEHFTYTMDIHEDILKYHTLKLILQPLVENAIYHGLKVKKNGGTITIKGYEDGDTIVFKVIDTGLGMSQEVIDAIHKTFDTGVEGQVTMYGIRNVHQRIQIFFGKEYGLRYESTYGEQTTATITLPKYLGDEKHAKNNLN